MKNGHYIMGLLINQWFLTGGGVRQKFSRGARALTRATTWEV